MIEIKEIKCGIELIYTVNEMYERLNFVVERGKVIAFMILMSLEG